MRQWAHEMEASLDHTFRAGQKCLHQSVAYTLKLEYRGQRSVWSLPRGDMQIRARCEYTPIISTLKKLRQEDGEFKASLSYTVPG